MSRVYEPELGVRTNLRDDEIYVIRFYAGGAKATVVEREHNILSLDEAQRNTKLCIQAMIDGITRWHNLGVVCRFERKLATNVIDAR